MSEPRQKGFFYEDSLFASSRKHEFAWRIKHGGSSADYSDVMTGRVTFADHAAKMAAKGIKCDPNQTY